MKRMKKLLILLFLVLSQTVGAQRITGVVVDAVTGDSIPFASVQYKGHRLAVVGEASGTFSIERRNGWSITFSALGYKSVKILIGANTPSEIRVTMKPDTRGLSEVKVKGKRGKYRRKDNPAIALMRRVIAAKKKTHLENHDYYRYDKYQKITLAVNDIQPDELEKGMFRNSEWYKNQVEVCPHNGKLILPLSVDETVTQNIYRRDPQSEKTIVKGRSTKGVNSLIETGEILNTMLKDVFKDVDLYDDQINLLHKRFISPIGRDAISFYRYYIEDTVYVGKDKCFHLQFLPNNPQDFGFRGEMWVLADSTLHVKRCDMTLPQNTAVNFVEGMKINQEYTQLPGGDWALTTDDMVVEMSLLNFLTKAIVMRTTRNSGYSFDALPDKMFRGMAKERFDPDAMIQGPDFWNRNRRAELSRSEASMDEFINSMKKSKNFGFVLFAAKAFIENFIELGDEKHPSKVDLGPVNTMISKNFIDGVRTRISGQTTANLNPHWFFSGYYARGWDSKKNYYKGEVTYSFNKKKYLPREFPKRTLTFTSAYDVYSPSDKFVTTDKDNVFTSFKWSEVNKMMFYNRQQLAFEYETDWGFRLLTSIKTEGNEACGELFFVPLSSETGLENAGTHGKLRTTEIHAELRYSPGETFINTKQRRIPANHDAPVFQLGHTMGIKGFMGGEYNYNFTEASIYKRLWLGSWGRLETRLKGGVQWNKVPFPLLIMPATNLSYIVNDETFSMINNMEFLNDRYASLHLSWDLNGKILNRIPLIRKLKWRESLGFNCLWGSLSDKNNPYVEANAGDGRLMYFPKGAYVMDGSRPYMEFTAGIHNIFKILHVQYVRRLSYLSLPTARKHGVRFTLEFSF